MSLMAACQLCRAALFLSSRAAAVSAANLQFCTNRLCTNVTGAQLPFHAPDHFDLCLQRAARRASAPSCPLCIQSINAQLCSQPAREQQAHLRLACGHCYLLFPHTCAGLHALATCCHNCFPMCVKAKRRPGPGAERGGAGLREQAGRQTDSKRQTAPLPLPPLLISTCRSEPVAPPAAPCAAGPSHCRAALSADQGRGRRQVAAVWLVLGRRDLRWAARFGRRPRIPIILSTPRSCCSEPDRPGAGDWAGDCRMQAPALPPAEYSGSVPAIECRAPDEVRGDHRWACDCLGAAEQRRAVTRAEHRSPPRQPLPHAPPAPRPPQVRNPARDSEAYIAWRAATDLRAPYRLGSGRSMLLALQQLLLLNAVLALPPECLPASKPRPHHQGRPPLPARHAAGREPRGL